MASSLLNRLGLSRPELRGWVAYDWANSVFMTSVIQVFQVYFASALATDLTKAESSARFYFATTIAALIVAVLGAVIGAMADFSGARKRIMAVFIALGVVATFGIALVPPGHWRAGLLWYSLGNVAIAVSFVLYDSLLPHVARPEEVDLVSSAGYAFGYLSGGLVLALNLVWISRPQSWGFPDAGAATRASFAFAAVWWAVFSVPLFRNVPEPPANGGRNGARRSITAAMTGTVTSLWATFHDLKKYREAFLMMIAFLIYNDGVNTVIRVGATYGTEIGIPQEKLLLAILAVQFIGLPFAYFYSTLASKVGTRRAIYLALLTYLLICFVGFIMTQTWQFYLLAFLIGTAQGGAQALSRSLFASLIPKEKSSEFFGFYGVGDRFAGIMGPALFWVAVTVTGSSRGALLGLGVFFVIGAFLLSRVDVDRGRALVASTRV
ncbi:MAG: MFS transporter [Vicinamibacteria bacterium]